MRPYLTLAAAAFLGLCGLAHADTINVFTLNAPLANGTATGTVTLDATTGKFTASNISVTTSFGSSTFTGAPTSVQSQTSYTQNVFGASNSLYSFSLDIPLASLVGYTGGSLCSTGALCTGLTATNAAVLGLGADAASTGTLTLLSTTAPAPIAAVTPEPSSLILLGTGVLGLGVLMRRRRIA